MSFKYQLWGCHSPNHHSPLHFRFQRLILRAEQLLPSSDWQAMANSCWAAARLQLGQRLVEVAAQQLRRVEPKRFERVKLQEIANIS